MLKPGKVREDDYGNLSFEFDDGTWAGADWEPIGELGDGQGGGFEEDGVEVGNSGLTVEEVLQLANANIGVMSGWVPITFPKQEKED